MVKKKLVLILGPLSLLLLTSLSFNWYLFREVEELGAGYQVVEVFDGDSFSLKTSQNIRLGDLNAPGLDDCLGQEAKKRLEELVLGKRIRLAETVRDRFGRTIASVYLGDIFINQVILEEGWGRYEPVGSKSKGEELKAASHRAREAKKGVYGPQCTQLEPPDPKCVVKGNIDKDHGEKIYHFPGCNSYNLVIIEKDRGEAWFCSEKEAQDAGFRRSQQCPDKIHSSLSK